MASTNARRMAETVSIGVRTKYVIPFEDFLSRADQKKLSVSMLSNPNIVNADFEFHWVFIDIKGGQSLEGALTIKHLLYLYYHHIFGVPVYVIAEWADKYIVINEYERIASWLPIPESGKLSMRRISNDTKIFSIRIWQEGEEFFAEVKKILKGFAPNQEYDKRNADVSDFTFQTGEIYEYFISASKNKGLATEDIRKRLADSGFDGNIPDDVLERQVAFVERFLSNVFQ